MFLREAVESLFGKTRRPQTGPIERAMAAYVLMLQDATLRGGVVSERGAKVAREILSGDVADPRQVAIDFFSEGQESQA